MVSFNRSLVLASLSGLALTAVSGVALADGPGIRLGQPSYGGNGCPQGTASAVLSPDQQSLSVLFDQFQASAGGSTGKQVDRVSCNVAIPVTVPQGFSISVFKIDYRGFASVPFGGNAQFDSEYFFAGSQGPHYSRQFGGGSQGDFTLTDTVAAQAVVWSACGADVNLRSNANLMVQTNQQYDDTMASIDSQDVDAKIVYSIQWRRCGDGPNPPNPPNPPTPPRPYPVGNCTVVPTLDQWNQLTYVINDFRGYEITRTSNQAQADSLARMYDQSGRCGGYTPPPPPVSECRLETLTDQFGRVVYRVSDRNGRVLGDYADYATATSAMAAFDRNGSCHGQNNPPPPPPSTFPGCTIRQGADSRGNTLWRVHRNNGGAILYTTGSYQDAYNFASRNPVCRQF